jgi:hypothetical protein
MPKKPADITINLTPKDPFFNSVIGRTLKWALSAGRYIIIFTELIVILSFIARFTLDRQVTDLNSDITKNISLIESYGTLENDFRGIQDKINHIETLERENNIVEVFPQLTAVTPDGINLESLNIQPDSVTIAGNTLSQNAFNLFVTNLQLSPDFHQIQINDVSNQDENRPGYKFQLQAKTRPPAQVTNRTTQEND